MKKRHLILAVAAVLAIAAGAGYAAIPSSNGTISACKDNKGVLKVIDAEAGQTCGNNQQLLTWNQQGPAGPQGPSGISGYEVVSSMTEGGPNNSAVTATASCPEGKVPIGGGGRINDLDSNGLAFIVDSHPFQYVNGWRVRAARNWETQQSFAVSAVVICANVS
jgi:hypothetical protein